LTWFANPSCELPYRDNAIQAEFKSSRFVAQISCQSDRFSRNFTKVSAISA
jgi:hypothetical protein